MKLKSVYLIFKIFIVFMAVLIAEYYFCGIYYRLIRRSDFIIVNSACGISGLGLGYLILRKLIRNALEEKLPPPAVWAFFLVFCFLLGFFLRFSVQLANGLLDSSDPESRVVVVMDKKVSSFGGSFKDGPNPMAHLIYFQDWDDSGANCEMLISPVYYYSAGIGTRLVLTVRRGFLHMSWVSDYQLLTPTSNGG